MEQKHALELLKLGNNVFLTGPAGSGKTYLLNRYIDYLRNHQVGIAITASTGIAATHINGRTIHSWSGMGVRDAFSSTELDSLQRDKRLRKNYLSAKVLLIDEVSMLHPHQLDLVNQIARHMLDPLQPFGGLQVILSGDFFQLPPVSQSSSKTSQRFAYESDAWKTGRFRTCYLTEQHRQGNDPLVAVLNDIRSGNAGEQTKIPLRTRYKQEPVGCVRPARLFARNVSVDKINQHELTALDGADEVFEMESTGLKVLVDNLKRSCPAPAELRLRIGAKVMFVKNDQNGTYVNGTLGSVVAFTSDDGWPVIRTFDNNTVVAEPENWVLEENGVTRASISQMPLKLAWAITVHKSQGMTLDAAEIDLSDAFEPGMGYVALSRVRSLSGIKLLGLNEIALSVNPKILIQDKVFMTWSTSEKELLKHIPETQRKKQQMEVILERFDGKLPWERKPPGALDKQQKKSAPSPNESTANAYEPWTAEDDDKLTILYGDNVSVGDLSNIFCRGRGAIRSRIKKLGLINYENKAHNSTNVSSKQKLSTTLVITRDLVNSQLPLEQIAKERDMTKQTIIVHLEKLKFLNELPDIHHLTRDIAEYDKIVALFKNSVEGHLSPIYHQLHGKCSYDDLRLIRIHAHD